MFPACKELCPRDTQASLELQAAVQTSCSLCVLCGDDPLGCSGKVMGSDGEGEEEL